MPIFSKTDLRWSWTVWREMKRLSVIARGVEPAENASDHVTLGPTEGIRAGEQVEYLLGRRVPQHDGDAAFVVVLKRSSLNHHPPSVDGTLECVRSGRRIP
jgi:hypothetical protein